jgi:hypothetical protein
MYTISSSIKQLRKFSKLIRLKSKIRMIDLLFYIIVMVLL